MREEGVRIYVKTVREKAEKLLKIDTRTQTTQHSELFNVIENSC